MMKRGREEVYGCTCESIMQDRGPSTRPYLQRAILQRVSERQRKKEDDAREGGDERGEGAN